MDKLPYLSLTAATNSIHVSSTKLIVWLVLNRAECQTLIGALNSASSYTLLAGVC